MTRKEQYINNKKNARLVKVRVKYRLMLAKLLHAAGKEKIAKLHEQEALNQLLNYVW